MTFGVLVFDGVEELDFIGPWEMLTMWRDHADGPECVLIGETGQAITCAKGMSVTPHCSLDSCPVLDFLLVPGGLGTRREVHNQQLLEFVALQAKAARAMLSVCTGAFILHGAGLLSGKHATTHWASLDRLRELGDVEVVERRYVRDGGVWSSAGVSAGIDMALAFIAHIAGEDVAAKVQFASEYYPDGRRYGAPERYPGAPEYIR